MLVKIALLRKLSSKQTVNGEKLQESFYVLRYLSKADSIARH